MKRSPMPRRRAPMPRGKALRSTGGLSRGSGPARGAPLERTKPMKARPRRQPAHSPFPMTCPPGFHADMMRRAGHRCQRCGCPRALTLSHRLDRVHGGPFTWWNIDVLCMGPASCGEDCHGWRTRNPAAATAEGWRVAGRIVRGHYQGNDDAYGTLVDAAREGRL